MANGLFNLKQVIQAVQQGGWNGQKPPAVEYLVVAGGGSGGSLTGGGAGGLLAGIDPVPNGQTLLVTVGAGGVNSGGQTGSNGSNSVFGNITTTGGGAGAWQASTNWTNVPGNNGGSGGGSAAVYSTAGNSLYPPGQGIAGQGNAGGIGNTSSGDLTQTNSGGGGGAGTTGLAGTNGAGGNGGAGIASSISGSVTAYAGGGAGASWSGTSGKGGTGGGGNAGVAGTANTGGGGGSASSGGSGIVIVSYPDVYAAPTTVTGGPTVSTSGSGSINCAGSSACLYYGGQTNFALSTGDFTIEMWLNPNTTAQNEFYDCRPSGGGAGTQYPVLYANAGKIFFFSNGVDLITGTTTLTTGTWYHIAVCRSGTSTKMFLNGVQEGSTYTDTNNYAVGSSRPVVMGNGSGSPGGTVFNGKISNLRVVKGTALYTSAFTPSTAPLTAVTNTQLLLNSISGAYLADSSTNSFVASVAGAPAWNSASPFTVTGYKNRVYTWTSSGSITF